MDTTFIDQLASKAPTPGGGGAAAYAGALAAALASMVGNLTVGKKTYAAVEDEMQAALAALEEERRALLGLVEADAQAFGPLAAAYRLPKETPQQQEAKHAALQAALIGACDVPLDIMRHVQAVVGLTEAMASKGSRMARSDAGVAAAFCRAAADGASLNILINAASMDDAAQAERYRQETEQLAADVRQRCDIVFQQVKSAVS